MVGVPRITEHPSWVELTANLSSQLNWQAASKRAEIGASKELPEVVSNRGEFVYHSAQSLLTSVSKHHSGWKRSLMGDGLDQGLLVRRSIMLPLLATSNIGR